MKNFYLEATCIFSVLFFQSTGLSAQWQSDVSFKNNQANKYMSENNTWCVESSGKVVQVVWQDGSNRVFYINTI